MEKLENYRRIVQEVLREYGKLKFSHGDIETEIIFDTERDHYQIFRIGWDKKRRVYGSPLHIAIKDGKVWIQENLTELDVAEELMSRGVARQDIVLGYLSPWMRQHSEFAAA